MDASELPPGTVIDDRYVVEDVIGYGGMALVWKVRHRDLGSEHALKVLLTRSPAVRERLVQEGRLQAVLRHPNLVAVTDLVVLDGGDPGLIMEYVQGPSLREILDDGALTLEQADALATGILAGVAEAHRSGLVHRDLKPSNILLEPGNGNYVPKVADFGIAKVLGDDDAGRFRTRSNTGLGTPHYMAPEQVVNAKDVGQAADIFALGVILYELVTHRRPFEGDSQLAILNAVAEGAYEPPTVARPDLPEAMAKAIEAALRDEPQDRPATVEALAELWFADRPPITAQVRPFPGVQRLVTMSRASGAWTRRPSASAPVRRPTSAGQVLVMLLAAAMAVGGFGMVALGGGVAFLTWPTTPEERDIPTAPATAKPVEPSAPALVQPEPEPVVEPEPVASDEPRAAPEPIVESTDPLQSSDPELRLAAIEQLAASSQAADLQRLGQLVQEEPNPRFRAAAWAGTLQAWNEQRPGARVLEDALTWQLEHGQRGPAVDAAKALGRYGNRPRSLLPGLQRNKAQVRLATLDAIVQIDERKPGFDWKPHLERLRNASTDEVRKKAERLLRKL